MKVTSSSPREFFIAKPIMTPNELKSYILKQMENLERVEIIYRYYYTIGRSDGTRLTLKIESPRILGPEEVVDKCLEIVLNQLRSRRRTE